ncbi:MAG: hypothetical protein WBP79_14700 [Candidatus Acidiferrales bacterium]
MNIIRKVVTTFGSIFLAALLIAALVPKATRGVVAALVQVVNTSANPVPTVSAEALNSFDANGSCGFFGTDNNHNDFCLVDPIYTVPTGKIAVVEHASGRCILDNGVGLREARLTTGSNQSIFFVPGPPAFFPVQNSISSFSESTKTYVSGGIDINMQMFSAAFQTDSFDSCVFDISGYLVNQ